MSTDDNSIGRDYSRSGFILPLTLSSPLASASGEISPRSFWSLLFNLEVKHGYCGGVHASDRRGGKSYCHGVCGGKIPCPSRFTSIRKISVCSCEMGGNCGWKFTLRSQRSEPLVQYTRPLALRCLSTHTYLLSKPFTLCQAACLFNSQRLRSCSFCGMRQPPQPS